MEQTDSAATTKQVPVVGARKALLVGLGTSGAMACGQIMERISWAYGSPANVPWVRCVVLETAEVSMEQRLLRENSRIVHMTIDRNQYAALITNPQNYENPFGYATWNIPQLTGTGDAITDGAKNTRILGRLALLYTPNFLKVKAQVSDALNLLTTLDNQEATEAFSKTTPDPVRVAFSAGTYVYVVGTLCGGTSGGAFIDLGYMLRALIGYSVITTGIFMLPSEAEQNERWTANAYASLVELNHFSSDRARYQQRFPDRADIWQAAPGTRPYDYTYLVQSRGAAKVEYARLVTATADYIYSDVIGGTADRRDSRRTNIQDYFTQTDVWGATQKFFTFGLGSIEFPYAKVLKACSLRLAQRGFQEIAGGEELSQAQIENTKSRLPTLALEFLIQRLLLRPDGTRLDTVLQRIMQNVAEDAVNSDDVLTLARAQAETGFKGTADSQTHADLAPNIIPMTIEENSRQAGEEMREAIIAAARSFLTGPTASGVNSLVSFLTALQKDLTAAVKQCAEMKASDPTAQTQFAADEAQERAQTCRKDFALRLTFGKRAAVRRYVEECIQNCLELYGQKLRLACAPVCERLYAENLAFVEKVYTRIQNQECGLAREVASIINKMANLYKRTDVPYGTTDDGSSRMINGTEIFEPGRTIEQEYMRCLRETAAAQKLTGPPEELERRFALSASEKFIRDALPTLFADTNADMRFDPNGEREVPPYDDFDILEIARGARFAFEPLKRRSIVDRLFAQPQRISTDLKDADEASRLFLNWAEGHPRHRDAPNKAYKFIFFDTEDGKAAAFIEQLEKDGLVDTKGGIARINDLHQIMILRERGAFSLGTIRELMDEGTSLWRGHYAQTAGIYSFHSRGDIKEWITWARADEDARVRLRNIFLVSVALKVVELVSATEYAFRFRPRTMGGSDQVILSNDLDMAAQTMKTEQIGADMEAKILKYRETFEAADVFMRIDEFARGSAGRFREGNRLLSGEEIASYLFDYVRQDRELLECYRQQYPNQAELRYLDIDSEGRPAYRCPCEKRQILGYTADCLYVTVEKDGKRQRLLQCALCGRSLAV
jgi:hypothetical protein